MCIDGLFFSSGIFIHSFIELPPGVLLLTLLVDGLGLFRVLMALKIQVIFRFIFTLYLRICAIKCHLELLLLD